MTLSTHIPEHPEQDSSIRGAEQFTEDQLHFLRVSREHAVRQALTRWVRGATVAFLLVFAALGYNQYQRDHDNADRRADAIAARKQIVKSGNAVAISGCNRDYHTAVALRAILNNAREFQRRALVAGDINKRQFERADLYYRAQLDKLTVPDCRVSGHILTDNPDRIVIIPTPLHQKHG